ncbi:hypothetical protein ACFYXH_03215 [Streptomyces sp. NPDC002730]|uniref:hypothetical protein n=1 Tax=Streptomyces sp. NPDC002730 TaxID=3364662 RepID=UPI0036A3A6EC
MSIRRTAKTRRVVAAVSMTAALALAITGCGGDDGDKSKNTESSSSKPAGDGGSKEDTAAGGKVDPNVKLAELNGRDGFVLTINAVQRDSGGFVTVSGSIKNTSKDSLNASGMEGSESLVVANNPNSVAGATLVDKKGKKRYYVLRDTDGRCLCTTGMLPIAAGGSTPVFMQFPAPPESTNEVSFTLPSFATADLKISR